MAIDTAKVDAVLQYSLLTAGEEDSWLDRELGPIHLIKYVYLADLAYARDHNGQTFTGAPWIFYNFGPWAPAVNERIKPAATAIQAECVTRQSNYGDKDEWTRWKCSRPGLKEQLNSQLPLEIRLVLQQSVHRFGQNTPSLLEHVYRSAPMLAAAPNETLNFALAATAVSIRGPHQNSVASLSANKQKRLREKMGVLRARMAQGVPEAAEVALPPPRYDEVFSNGMAWLDSLAGQPLNEGEITAEFSEDIWKSSARSGDGLP